MKIDDRPEARARRERVKRVKRAITEGTLIVDSRKLAEALLTKERQLVTPPADNSRRRFQTG